jgi:hypothetical protein
MTSRTGQRWADVQPCGTEAAYNRHHRHGEPPCPADRRAATLSRALRRERAERQAADTLGELFRQVLDLIAAECRRAGILP